MDFGIEKSHGYNKKPEPTHDGVNRTNQEKIRTLGEKETYK